MDRKIDNGYYTFIDGQMQTGWINVAEAGFVSSSTPSNEAATADNSATDTVSLNDFRYYDPENGGRRASGWYTIEGAPVSYTHLDVYKRQLPPCFAWLFVR